MIAHLYPVKRKVFKEIMKFCYKDPLEVTIETMSIDGNTSHGCETITVVYALKPMPTIKSQLKLWEKAIPYGN